MVYLCKRTDLYGFHETFSTDNLVAAREGLHRSFSIHADHALKNKDITQRDVWNESNTVKYQIIVSTHSNSGTPVT